MYNGAIPDITIRRIGKYMRTMETLDKKGITVISSREMGEMLECTSSQVRQDLSYFGKYGLQGFGYAVGLLRDDLIHILGADRGFPAAVVGTDFTGAYLLKKSVLQKRGLRVVSAFDKTPHNIGRAINGVTVRNIDELPDFVQNTPVLIAVLCVPPEDAQETAEKLIANGVKAIWNITGRDLTLPTGIAAESTHLEDSLLSLAYRLKESQENEELASGE